MADKITLRRSSNTERKMEEVKSGQVEREPPSWKGSKRIASVGVPEEPPVGTEVVFGNGGGGKDLDNEHHNHDGHPDHKVPAWRKFMGYVGPGFLVSFAYLDPGNLETDLQAGSNHRYELLWIILIRLVFALIIQSLAANLGVTTGKHLAELCKAEYPKYVKICLWILAEIAVIAADVPEVIGTASALIILFHIPVWAGVLLTGLSTLLLLGLQRYGVRKLEMLMAMLVFVMAACYFGELSYVKPPASKVLEGLFVPKLNGTGAVADAIALFGALIMPHNLFLHSALVPSRKTPPSTQGINTACRYFLWESAFALVVALLINISVVSVTGTVCAANELPAEDEERCSDLTLNSASFLLKMILSFELPFALIPLLKFSSSHTKMGPHKNSTYIIVISWILGLAIIGVNIYYLGTGFVGWIIHSKLPPVVHVLVGIVVFPLMAVYVLAVLYLMVRKDTVVTFISTDEPSQVEMESGCCHKCDGSGVPFRRDLEDNPLPD